MLYNANTTNYCSGVVVILEHLFTRSNAMFNDNFSPNWEAYWNEEKLPIMRANGLFMAVIIPSGSGELNFVFNPRLFSQLSRASFLIGAALISGWLWLLYSMIRRKRMRRQI